MRFKEVYESENNFDDTYKPCSKHGTFHIDCDDCVDANDMDLSDFDFDLDDDWDDQWTAIGDEVVNESLKKITVVRKGQKKIKYKSDKEGFRVEMQNGKPKEIKMLPIEIRKRDIGQKRAQIKRKQKMPKAQKLRAKSLIKRKQMGLKSMFAK
jgi:hypothetical protein